MIPDCQNLRRSSRISVEPLLFSSKQPTVRAVLNRAIVPVQKAASGK